MIMNTLIDCALFNFSRCEITWNRVMEVSYVIRILRQRGRMFLYEVRCGLSMQSFSQRTDISFPGRGADTESIRPHTTRITVQRF